MAEAKIVKIVAREAVLKGKLRRHLTSLGFSKTANGSLQIEGESKGVIRTLHAAQREARLKANAAFLKRRAPKLLSFFAAGEDIEPERITPILQRVTSNTLHRDLFRFASLTWSVPVSNGFGRRIRYLVWDQQNGKLMGLIAIGDPVFNLKVRDEKIGWDVRARGERLVNIMDAYVLGAIPPYNKLLGGKVIASLLRSREIYTDFSRIYGNTTGIISGKKKRARLLAITTSSSLGRSSVYNRLKIGEVKYLTPLGYTGGWGHFHIPDKLFGELRSYLRASGHKYADLHEFGQGPNWRLRTTRAALDAIGFRADMLKHGIRRQVFVAWLADNAEEILKTGKGQPNLNSLQTASEVASVAVARWMVPRSRTRPDYLTWTRDDLLNLFGSQTRPVRSAVKKAG